MIWKAAWRCRGAALAAWVLSLGSTAGTAEVARSELLIEGARTFPESITSTKAGAIFTGSLGTGAVLRAAPGAASASVWIQPGSNGLLDTFGVLADEASNTLWVCSSRPADAAAKPALFAFNLSSAAFKARYDLPGGTGLCNDIAIGPDKATYVAETRGGRLLRLAPGATSLQEWIKTADLAGADGLAFIGRQLYVNTYGSGKLLRIELGANGTPGALVTLKTSRPLQNPDGMRAVGGDHLIMAEGAGRFDLLSVKDDAVEVTTLREGFTQPVGVTLIGNTVWGLEGKLSLMRTQGADPQPFKAYALPLPPR